MFKKNLYKKITGFLNKYNQRLLAIVFLFIVADILFVADKSDITLFFVLGLYGLCIKRYKLTSKLTFYLCLFVLLLMFFMIILTRVSIATEKAAVWLFLLLAIGIIQGIKEA